MAQSLELLALIQVVRAGGHPGDPRAGAVGSWPPNQMSTLPPTITPAMARRIEIWPTDRLVPYAKNARTHSPEQVAQIAASIVEFGFVNPILVDSTDGIIAGHGRFLAARKLGLAEVPVVVLGHLSEIQRRAYIIADNQLALNAGWNDELLRVALESLGADGFGRRDHRRDPRPA